MPRTKRPSTAYPREFLQIFLKVAESGDTQIIDGMGKDVREYHRLRHALNGFRAAFREEAEAGRDNSVKAEQARMITGVVIRLRKEPPALVMEPSGAEFRSAITQAMGGASQAPGKLPYEPLPEPAPPAKAQSEEGESAAADALKSIYSSRK